MGSLAPMMMHSRAELDTWIATIDDRREELEALMQRELGCDSKTLDVIEAFLLQRYPSIDAALALDQRGVIDAAARVVGVAFKLGIAGSSWSLDLDGAKNVYYRLPVVVMPDGMPMCPITMVTASLDRRTGTFISSLLEGLEEHYATSKPRPKAKPKAKATAKRRRS